MWIAQQDPFGRLDCTFDLRDITLITPAALVQVAATCHALAQDGRRPHIVLGTPAVRSYLIRAGFMSAVEAVARFTPFLPRAAYVSSSSGSKMLIEVTRIQKGSELPNILDKVVAVLCEQLQYRTRDAYDVAIAISEVAQNTFDHNGHICGFLAMQVYGNTGQRFLEIGVADYGQGLATTLQRNPNSRPIPTDLAAIRQATQLGASEYDDPTRGTGLYHLLKIAYAHDGMAQIRSGAAKMRFRMDKERGWAFTVYPLPGVQIALELQAKG